jgi:hypothetical protein
MLRDAAISLSLANLCFVKVWGKALSGAGAYFAEFRIAYAAILLDVVLLALVFFIGARLVRANSNRFLQILARLAFLLSLLTVVNGVMTLGITLSGVNFSTLLGRSTAYFAGLAFTFALVAVAFIARQRIINFAPRLVLVSLPFVLVTFTQAVFNLTKDIGVVHAASERAEKTTVPAKTPATRVLWIVFDEFDQRLTFAQRPATVELPELDRLRSESLYAENAYPPAPLTYMSMPALITGRLVEKVAPIRTDELMVKFAGEEKAVAWSTQPNVFSKAQASGFTTGLAGWCHPYCEVIGGDLTSCDEVKDKSNDEVSLATSMFLQAEGLASTVPLVTQTAIPVVQRVNFVNQLATSGERKKYTVRYKYVLDSSLKAATNPNLDLVFVHSPAPHPPGIYDRFKNDFSIESRNSYIDNLELVDRTVGEIRRAMEKAGVWEKTTVIISADHWWRSEMWSRGPFWTTEDARVATAPMDHRIPFLVKPAGKTDQLTYQPGFNTVLTQELVLALMRGEVSGAEQIAAWLDRNRSIADSPHNRDELLP